MNEFRIVYLPDHVWQAVKTLGIPAQAVGELSEAFTGRMTDQDLALTNALGRHPDIARALGYSPNAVCRHDDRGWDRFMNIVSPLSQTSYIQSRLADMLSGDYVEGSACVQVVDLGHATIGVVFGQGALDALRRDNYVLALLNAIMQKALVFGSVEALMASSCSGLVSRFVMVNAFANPHRAPNPVYR